MTAEILGRREDQRLELKSRRVMDDPSKVARAVVAMLNAGGGEIWIGVEEEDGVAAAIEPVADPERARDQLRDYLMDALDPSPTAEEVSIDLVPAAADSALLVVRARPKGEGSRRFPYAFRKAGGWHFVRRVGARNHPMSRQQVFHRPGEIGEDVLEPAVRDLGEDRRAAQEKGEAGLWLGIQPERELRLDPADPLFERIVLDPSLTGNRLAGSHFARASSPPVLGPRGLEWGLGSESKDLVVRVAVTEAGALRFWAALEELARGPDEREIGPLPLLEYPISGCRIARGVYGDRLEPEDRVVADLALFGVAGWGLRAGTPGGLFLGKELRRADEPDLIWEPVTFTFREIDEAPDRCGFRLVRRVYHAFGWREIEMPRQFDQQSGRLVLPE